MSRLVPLALLSALSSCAPAPAPLACNGSEELCDKRFDQVAYPTSHNAMAVDAEGFVVANQHRTMAEQLDDGIRAMMLDLHSDDTCPAPQICLCHALCSFGMTPLADGLATIKTFLDAHPHEVFSIQFESYVPAPAVAALFQAGGLDAMVVTQPLGAPWPTLREMITSGHRLVVFYEDDKTGAGDGAPAWYMPLFQYSFETPFSAEQPSDLTCTLGRGALGHSLFTLNNFLTTIAGDPSFAAEVNVNPFLINRAQECEQTFGHIPNFVAVDYEDVGNLFAAVRTLNGL